VPGDTTALIAHLVDDLGADPNMDLLFCENGALGAWRGGRDDTMTPLGRAAQWGNYTAVVALLQRGAEPRRKTKVLGVNALFHAADFGFLRILVQLCDAGASVHDVKDSTGNTALHVAAQNGAAWARLPATS